MVIFQHLTAKTRQPIRPCKLNMCKLNMFCWGRVSWTCFFMKTGVHTQDPKETLFQALVGLRQKQSVLECIVTFNFSLMHSQRVYQYVYQRFMGYINKPKVPGSQTGGRVRFLRDYLRTPSWWRHRMAKNGYGPNWLIALFASYLLFLFNWAESELELFRSGFMTL